MSRSRFRWLWTPLLGVLIGLGCSGCRRAIPLRHVLLVCIDTLRFDHVGSYGYSSQTTPHLDELAARGLRIEKAFATSNWTLPSIASVLTGLPPTEHGAGLEGEVRRLGKEALPTGIRKGIPTLASAFSALGFSTRLDSANPFLRSRELREPFDVGRVKREPAESLVNQALEWFGAAGEQRLFVYLQFMDVHHPNRPPSPYYEMFGLLPGEARDPGAENWRFGQLIRRDEPGFAEFERQRAGLYDGSIRYVDDQIGRLVAGLREMQVLDETLIVVFSDHGEELWEHAVEESKWGDDPRGVWGVGHGHSMYEELVRVPLIVSGPGVPAGEVEECPVSLLDIGTIALTAAAGESRRFGVGQPLGGGASGKCKDRIFTVSSNAFGPRSAAVRQRDLKIVRRGGKEEIFDLSRDPEERNALVGETSVDPTNLRRILQALMEWRPRQGLRQQAIGADSLEELRALGYL